MSKRHLKWIGLVLCGSMLLVALVVPAAAQEIDTVGFSAKAITPENQVDPNLSYFDLRVRPGDTQTISVYLTNEGKTDIIVDVALRAASTNRNGVIEYQIPAAPDETLVVPFDTISKTNPEISVPANSAATVNVEIRVPEQPFSGTVLGGIVLTKRTDGTAESAVGIDNRFSYVIGVKLTEDSAAVAPEFRIKSVEPTLVNYRSAMSVGIQNRAPLIIKNANVTVDLYQGSNTTPLLSVTKAPVDFAPNSVFPLPVEWNDLKMDPGAYHVAVKLNHEGKMFELTQDFTVGQQEANQVNQGTLFPPASNAFDRWLWPVVTIVLLIAAFLLFFFWRKSKKDS